MSSPVIEDYIGWKIGQKGICSAWEKNTRHLLLRFCEYLKADPLEATTNHFLKAVSEIRRSKYKQNYRRQLINTGKSFGIWLSKINKNVEAGEIKSIELPKTQWKTKRPEDMLTPDELTRIIMAARSPRDQAFVAMVYDGSNRPIELLRLKWHDLIFDDYGAYFLTDAKTDKERRIRLTNISLGYLDKWKAAHPDPKPDQYVFCTINAVEKGIRPLTIDNVQRIMKLLKRDTGITKLKASIFRPSRITADVSSGVELPYIMKKNWGHLRTKMIDIYTNVDSNYLDNTALRHANMKTRDELQAKKIYKVESPVCPACHSVNLIGSNFCSKCLGPLTEEGKRKDEKLKERLEENPIFKAAYEAALAAISAKK